MLEPGRREGLIDFDSVLREVFPAFKVQGDDRRRGKNTCDPYRLRGGQREVPLASSRYSRRAQKQERGPD